MSKQNDKAKGNKGKPKGNDGKPAADGIPSLASHPRASGQIRRAKAIGGLVGFALAAYASLRAGVPADQVGLRALGAGVVAYMLAWAAAVMVWRHLLVAELRALIEQRVGRQQMELAAPDGEPAERS